MAKDDDFDNTLTIPIARATNMKLSKGVVSFYIDFNRKQMAAHGVTLEKFTEIIDECHELVFRPVQKSLLDQASLGFQEADGEVVREPNQGGSVSLGASKFKENQLDGRLLTCLTRNGDLKEQWHKLSWDGATDEEIAVLLGKSFGKQFQDGAAGVAYLYYLNNKGEHQIYLAKRLGDIPGPGVSEPNLTGEKVIARIRQIFDIGKSKANGDGKPTTAKKSTKPPKTAGAKMRSVRSGERAS